MYSDATVTGLRRATPTTRILRVRPAATFSYRAGQAAEIGPRGAASLTPYSIASAPEDTARDGQLEFLIKLNAQGKWGELFDLPQRGEPMRLRGPFGRFTFPEEPGNDDFLFIAGGTGVAPLRAMIRHGRTRAAGAFKLLYSARTPDDFAYRLELCGMARRGEIELTLTATRDVPSRRRWRGERGRITQAQLQRLLDGPQPRCFVCGPASMVDEVPLMLRALGIEGSRIQVEEWA